MNDKLAYIPVNEPNLNGNEKTYLNECINTGWISSEGPFIEKFEAAMAKRVSRTHGIAVANGSAALDIAVAALRLGKGDEVILPSFTIISCAASIVRAGATPVVVDCDPITWNMTAEHVASAITTRTRAIMLVHIYGLPVDLDPILILAEKYSLYVIEDAAQMHGQLYKNQPCGSFGDISTFSFYPNKLVTTGEGGMILCNDHSLADRCRKLRNLCFEPYRRFIHEEIGWNYRMTNMQAAIGLAQLEKLDQTIKRKRQIGRRYTAGLQDLLGLQLPLDHSDYAESLYWIYGIVLEDEICFDAVSAMERLHAVKIGTRPFFWPMHKQPVFKRMGLFKDAMCPVSEKLANRGFYLPSGLTLTDEQIDRIVSEVRQIYS